MRSVKIDLLSIVFLFVSVSAAKAVPIVYTDRGLWLSSVSQPLSTEDFESDQISQTGLALPYTTSHGITIDWEAHGGTGPSVQILDQGYVNNSQEANFTAYGTRLLFEFPGDQQVTAFGFDYYYEGPETWVLNLPNVEVVLDKYQTGDNKPYFVGIQDMMNPISSFIMTAASRTQGGLSIDNISYNPVPEPATVVLLGLGFVWMKRRLA